MSLHQNPSISPSEDKNIQEYVNVCNETSSQEKNLLLRLFFEYAWIQKEDVECLDQMAVDFKKWLDIEKIDVSDELWCFSNKLDVRLRSKVELTKISKSNQSLLEETRVSNDRIAFARLAFNLRKLLPLLIIGEGDVNYRNNKEQTLMHVFLEECEKVTERSSIDWIVRIRKLMQGLMKSGASLYTIDKSGKMPFDVAAHCKDDDIMRAIASCLDVEATDHEGNTALHLIFKNSVDENLEHKGECMHIVRVLVSRGADVNRKNNKGVSPAHLAAEKFNVEILQFLAKNGADFNQRTQSNESPLHFASKSTLKPKDSSAIIATLDFLVEQGCDLEATDEEGYMPLHRAAEFGSGDVVKKLMALGTNVDCRSKSLLLTPLYLAAKSDKLDNMKALVEAGADVNAEAVDGSTPLFMSVMWGSLESMRFLMDQGADVHRREQYRGFTLLHLAAHKEFRSDDHVAGKTKFHVLIDQGLDVDDPGHCGVTPLHMALSARNTDFVRILIERGANANSQNDRVEWTALHVAAIKKDLLTLQFLIDIGCDVDCRGSIDGSTPLHLALIENMPWGVGLDNDDTIEREFSLIVKFWRGIPYVPSIPDKDFAMLLIDNGADVNARDNLRRSPLHWATLSSDVSLMRMLLDAGVEVNVQDEDGKLPLHHVLANGNVEAFKLILEFGADINDHDVSEEIARSSDELKNVAVQHSIKLDLIGLPIAKIYNSFIRSPEFADFYETCSTEAKDLDDYCDGGVSLFRFLHMDGKRQHRFIEKMAYINEDIEVNFPLYATVIGAACREAYRRRPILEKAKIAWDQISDTHLPDLCVDMIFSQLNNRSLHLLALSIENRQNVASVNGRKIAFGIPS